MKEPIAARGNNSPAPREAAAPARRAVEGTEMRVVARYYRRMRTQRVYPLVVELQGAGASAAAPVFINPVIPGALVTPAEQALDPMVTGSTATFHVTPLARGTLRGARLDVFHQGKLIQEIRLGICSATQRLTWVLAALTLLVPLFLLYFTVYHPMVRVVPKALMVRKAEPGQPGVEPLKHLPKELPQPLKEGEEDEEELQEDTQLVQKGEDPAQNDAKPKKSGRGAAGPIPDEPPSEFEERFVAQKLIAGDALEWEINQHVPDRMKMPWQGEDDPPYEVPFEIVKHVAWGLGLPYTYAYQMSRDHVSFWVGVGFLALTIVSAVTHRAVSKRQRGKPLILAGSALAPHSAGAR